VKIITTAEGGMALTNRAALQERMRLLRSHGVTRDDSLMTQKSHGSWYYEQVELGFNYRITDMQAALGLSQMRRLDDVVAARNRLAERYDSLLKVLPLTLPARNADCYSAFHLYIIRLKRQYAPNHRAIFEALRERGIGVNLHYIPVYAQPYYRNLGFNDGYCPEAERYYAEAITLPLFHHMSEIQQDTVVRALGELIS